MTKPTFKAILQGLQKEPTGVDKKARKVPSLCPNCKENAASSPRSCPYDVEINEGNKLCYCCADCRQDCADEV